MTTTKKMFALPVAAAVVALSMGGCVTVDNTPVSAPKTGQSSQEAQAPEPHPTEEAAPQPSDGGEPESETAAPEIETIDLSPESGTLYLHAVQAFSPEFEAWTIDTEAGTVEYRRYSCLGTTQGIGVGSIAPREGGDEDAYMITWEGENPGRAGNGSSLQDRVTVSEKTLQSGSEVSTTHHDIEVERFTGLCKDAGEMVAGFVF